jgi:hypothetical protein
MTVCHPLVAPQTIGQVELRMNNFFIRACFHDGMAVVADCPTCSGLGEWLEGGRGEGVQE